MFENRKDAGRKLALKIKKTIGNNGYSVIGIARGGVVLGKIIADCLNVSLHILVIRKIGVPSNKELAIGAVGSKKIVYWDEDLIKRLKVSDTYRLSALKEKAREVENLEKIFSINKKGLDFRDKRVILVDDGVATGTTVLCAHKILKMQRSKQIILATPVISKESFKNIRKYFDKIIVLEKPLRFWAVGQFYREFPQVEDEEVIKILRK
ncbi:MAG: phosphoribosyltransferase family protein [Patescibacteria group bacterium]